MRSCSVFFTALLQAPISAQRFFMFSFSYVQSASGSNEVFAAASRARVADYSLIAGRISFLAISSMVSASMLIILQ